MMKIAIVSSKEIEHSPGRIFNAVPYADPMQDIDQDIERAKKTIAKYTKQLENLLELRERITKDPFAAQRKGVCNW